MPFREPTLIFANDWFSKPLLSKGNDDHIESHQLWNGVTESPSQAKRVVVDLTTKILPQQWGNYVPKTRRKITSTFLV